MSDLYVPTANSGWNRASHPIDMARCRAQTYDNVSRNFSQCARKAVVHEDGIGYCKQHSPEETRRRSAASQRKADIQRMALARRFERPENYRDVLREIAAGHNDPRTLAREVLAKWNDEDPTHEG